MSTYIANNFAFSEINILFAMTGLILVILTGAFARKAVRRKARYVLVFSVFILSFLGVIFAESWLLFIIAWELVTITTSLFLFRNNSRNAFRYFVVQFSGSMFLVFVIVLAINQGYETPGYINEFWLQTLFILGLGVKSAILGLHFWLPAVYVKASPYFCALSSGWVVKLGYIMLLRLIPEGNVLLLYVGVLMIFYGGIKALLAVDYKLLLGYSTISQLGYITMAVGSGTEAGYVGAVFYILAHGFAKTGLFLEARERIKEYGSSCIYNFKSGLKRHKLSVFHTIIAFSSLMGFPLLAGYNGKYFIKSGLETEGFLLVCLYIASILTIMYSLRFLKLGFVGDSGFSGLFKADEKEYSGGKIKLISLVIFILLIIFLGLFPSLLMNIINGDVFEVNLFSGFLESLIFVAVAWFVLRKLQWLKVSAGNPPSFDRYFAVIYNFICSMVHSSKRYEGRKRFEKVLYNDMKKAARGLYNLLYRDFQLQLLWIPFSLILLLLWISIYAG